MQDAIFRFTNEMQWRVTSILRTQRYSTIANMFRLYEAKVLSSCEYRMAAISYVCTSLLQQSDRVQERLLEEIGTDAVTALSVFNLAP